MTPGGRRGARDRLAALLAGLDLTPEDEALERLSAHAALLEKWGARINLAGSTEWRTLGPLFLEALWAASIYPQRPLLHLDVGSGGGFPALPIRILRPEMRLVMVEPRTKRAVFLETVVRELVLEDVEVHGLRVEELLATDTRTWDVVSSKGLRLGAEAVERIRARMAVAGELWIFHGRDLPVDDHEVLESRFRRVGREQEPSRIRSVLSRYRPR